MATSHVHIGDNFAVTGYEIDATSALSGAAGWVDMRDFSHLLVLYTRIVGTGPLLTYRIDASASSNGANPVVVKSGTTATCDAVGDYVKIEVSAQEIAAALADARYVSLVVISTLSADKGGVTYIRKALRPYAGLTADHIA